MEDLIMIAFALSVLTYYLGTLIYALPIPWWGIKRWAPTLIYDGATAALLIFSLSSVTWFVDYLSGVLGIDWASFYAWLAQRTSILVSLTAALSVLRTSTSGGGLGGIFSDALGPLVRTLSYVTLVLEVIALIAMIVQNYWTKLLVLGVALYSVPFRVARGVGASMVSLAVVFYLGLPLLPVFVDFFSPDRTITIPEPSMEDLGSPVYCIGVVRDYAGNPIPLALVEFRLGDRVVAAYVTDGQGVVRAGRPDRGLPYGVNLTVRVYPASTPHDAYPLPFDTEEYLVFDPTVDPSADFTFELVVPSVKLALGPQLLIESCDNVTIDNYSFDPSADELSFTAYSYGQATINVTVPYTMQVEEVLVDGELVNASEYQHYYNGTLIARSYRFQVDYGCHEVLVEVDGSVDHTPPSYEEVYFIRDTLGESGTNDNVLAALSQYVSELIVCWVVLPASYITMLLSISYSLARVIGGRDVRVLIRRVPY